MPAIAFPKCCGPATSRRNDAGKDKSKLNRLGRSHMVTGHGGIAKRRPAGARQLRRGPDQKRTRHDPENRAVRILGLEALEMMMKLLKSSLLGSAAALAAVGAVQAADLPVKKAVPIEFVRVCSAYGAGFFYIPAPTPASVSRAAPASSTATRLPSAAARATVTTAATAVSPASTSMPAPRPATAPCAPSCASRPPAAPASRPCTPAPRSVSPTPSRAPASISSAASSSSSTPTRPSCSSPA